jgi:hypothetical protein
VQEVASIWSADSTGCHGPRQSPSQECMEEAAFICGAARKDQSRHPRAGTNEPAVFHHFVSTIPHFRRIKVVSANLY